jgi:hypothetical protein
MQNKIEARPYFKSDISDNPFNLLKAIKEHSTSYQENCYNMSVILDAMKTLLNRKHKEGETLQDYTKRFRIAREVLESHIGEPIILTKIVKTIQGYIELPILDVEAGKNCKYKENVFEKFLAYLYLENSDQAKYGSILSGLITQQSLKNDQYPKTITEANNMLSNHKFDNMKYYNKNPTNTNKNSQKTSKKDKEPEKIDLSFAQLEGKCYCCRKAGHMSPQYCFKDKPKAEWFVKKSQQSHFQANKNENLKTKPSTST